MEKRRPISSYGIFALNFPNYLKRMGDIWLPGFEFDPRPVFGLYLNISLT